MNQRGSDSPLLTSVAELKMLGALVRWQDLPSALAETAEEEPQGYPLHRTNLRPHPDVDLLIGETWHKVRFLGVTGSKLTFDDGSGSKSVALRSSDIAPAGYYTDSEHDYSQIESADLSDEFSLDPDTQEQHGAELISIDPPYVTFRIKWAGRNARWVDDSDFRYTNRTFHVADPRVVVPGVPHRPHHFNAPIAVSHRWLAADHPDPRGEQFAELIETFTRLGIHDSQPVFIDYCSLPQRPRTEPQEQLFREQLPEFHRHYQRKCVILNQGAQDYATRAWCMLELMLAAMNDSILNRSHLRLELEEADRLAHEHVQHAAWSRREMNRVFAHGVHHQSMQAFLRDPTMVGLYNKAQETRAEIVRIFENELATTEPEDIPIVVSLVKELCLR